MKKNNFLIILSSIVIFIFNSCASIDPYKYRDSRMVFKIHSEEPQIKEINQPFYLINKNITIFPFIDNRTFENVFFATDIPVSLLFSKTLYKSLSKNFVFNQIKLADKNIYNNKTITFDENNFPFLKDFLKTDAVMWGIIYEFDIIISPDKIQQQYILTLHARGDIKIMSGNGLISYYHDFNKTRSYLFKTGSFFSYTLYDIKSLGVFINNFCEWIIDGETNHFIANSKGFINGESTIENIIPDILTYPSGNTKLYDASIIYSAIFQKQFINGLGILGGAFAGFTAAFYLSGGKFNNISDNSGTAIGALLLGAPIGAIVCFFITNYFTDKMYEENEKRAIFYAQNKWYEFTMFFPFLNFKL